jgi:hypothetical protein
VIVTIGMVFQDELCQITYFFAHEKSKTENNLLLFPFNLGNKQLEIDTGLNSK